MSVKTILPILGVGSAFAIFALAVAHRRSGERIAREGSRQRRLANGVRPRGTPGEERTEDAVTDATFAPMSLTREFWDGAADSYSLDEQPSRPAASLEAYDAIDTDLSAEWLARATEAPVPADPSDADADDPAEIAADSLSMISDASRRAAGFELDDPEPPSDSELPRE